MWSKAFPENPLQPSSFGSSTSWMPLPPLPRLLCLSLQPSRILAASAWGLESAPPPSQAKGVNYKIYAGCDGRGKAAAGVLGHRGEAVSGCVWASPPTRDRNYSARHGLLSGQSRGSSGPVQGHCLVCRKRTGGTQYLARALSCAAAVVCRAVRKVRKKDCWFWSSSETLPNYNYLVRNGKSGGPHVADPSRREVVGHMSGDLQTLVGVPRPRG